MKVVRQLMAPQFISIIGFGALANTLDNHATKQYWIPLANLHITLELSSTPISLTPPFLPLYTEPLIVGRLDGGRDGGVIVIRGVGPVCKVSSTTIVAAEDLKDRGIEFGWTDDSGVDGGGVDGSGVAGWGWLWQQPMDILDFLGWCVLKEKGDTGAPVFIGVVIWLCLSKLVANGDVPLKTRFLKVYFFW